MSRSTRGLHGALLSAVLMCGVASPTVADAASGAGCNGQSYASTFALIQDVIFERHSCSDQLCHGAAVSGGLDLRPEVAYGNLVDVPAETVAGFNRVTTGDKQRSLLWINLAAKTNPAQWHAPLRPMPLDPLPALTPAELELVRLWITDGAPPTGTVDGTQDLVDACLPPPEPITIKPLPPPANGVQFVAPPTLVRAHAEHEICFAQYYDVSAQVPLEARSPDGTQLRYRRTEVRQTPMSHHLVMTVYRGTEPLDSPAWGEFVCWGGARDGQACDRFDPEACGAGIPCATRPVPGVGCVGFGPVDSGFTVNVMGDSAAGQAAAEQDFAPGVYDELPLKGIIVWNSHAFNLTATDGMLEAWLNYDFAAPAQQRSVVHRITNIEQIFKMQVPAFGTEEVCHREVLPPHAHLFMLNSHTHRHGKRFRIFRGAFTCQGGPHDGEPCSSIAADFVSPDICGGARCAAPARPHAGDCDFSGDVSIDEIVRAVNIALGVMPMDACSEADADENRTVAVDDLLKVVNAGLSGVPPAAERDPLASLLYVSLVYNDPVNLHLDPPLVMPGDGSTAADRTLTFCALYDNGYTHPAEVKTRAGSPPPPVPIGIGGPCRTPTGCTQGVVGQPCQGANDRLRNASCDTSATAGDGVCDACPAIGGLTTEDEMLVMIGQYYLPEE